MLVNNPHLWFFCTIFFQESKNFPMQPTYVSCYERFAQLWELVKVNSNTRLWEEEMLNPLTGLDAVKIETECCFLRHQYSTADWTKAAYSGEKKRSVRREKHKKLMLRSCTSTISKSMILWDGCCSCRERDNVQQHCKSISIHKQFFFIKFSNVLN